MKYILTLMATILCSASINAQIKTKLPIDTAKQDKKHPHSLSIGTEGICYDNGKPKDSNQVFEFQFGMLDLGVNSIQDNTDYSSAAARSYLHVDDAHMNADLFSLRASKSINVN